MMREIYLCKNFVTPASFVCGLFVQNAWNKHYLNI